MPHAGHGEPALLAPFALPRHSGRAAPLCSSGGSRALRIDRSDYSPSDDEGAEDSIYIRFNQRDHGRSCGEPVLSADFRIPIIGCPHLQVAFLALGESSRTTRLSKRPSATPDRTSASLFSAANRLPSPHRLRPWGWKLCQSRFNRGPLVFAISTQVRRAHRPRTKAVSILCARMNGGGFDLFSKVASRGRRKKRES